MLYVNSQELKNITGKVLSNSTSPFYFNPFAVDGGVKIPVKVHPDLPPGTLIGWCEHLPPAWRTCVPVQFHYVITTTDVH